MLEAVIGNAIACVLAYVLLNLPLYFIFRRFQKDNTKKMVASIYFKAATIALVLHCFSLPLYDTVLIHVTAESVLISVFYWLHIAYLFMCYNELAGSNKKQTQKEDDQ